MKQEAEFFDGRETRLLYIGKRLSDSLALEQLLTASEIDYCVEADTYRGGVIFQNDRIGAFFYVLPQALESAREVLVRNGYKPAEPEP